MQTSQRCQTSETTQQMAASSLRPKSWCITGCIKRTFRSSGKIQKSILLQNLVGCSAAVPNSNFFQFKANDILRTYYGALGSTVLIADNSMSKMIELTTKQPYCFVHTDRGNIRNMLLAADASRVRQMSDDSIEKLEDVCRDKAKLTELQGGFIYPGTKWCGPGDRAANFSDLGYYVKEDMCCREHDNCPKYLMKGECREGICNNSPYTRSHCDCDASFRKCLQNVNSETANTIGAIYFNIIQVICFKERSPCSEWQRNSSDISEIIRENIKSFFNVPAPGDCKLRWEKSERYVPTRPSGWPVRVLLSKKNFIANFLAHKIKLFG